MTYSSTSDMSTFSYINTFLMPQSLVNTYCHFIYINIHLYQHFWKKQMGWHNWSATVIFLDFYVLPLIFLSFQMHFIFHKDLFFFTFTYILYCLFFTSLFIILFFILFFVHFFLISWILFFLNCKYIFLFNCKYIFLFNCKYIFLFNCKYIFLFNCQFIFYLIVNTFLLIIIVLLF